MEKLDEKEGLYDNRVFMYDSTQKNEHRQALIEIYKQKGLVIAEKPACLCVYSSVDERAKHVLLHPHKHESVRVECWKKIGEIIQKTREEVTFYMVMFVTSSLQMDLGYYFGTGSNIVYLDSREGLEKFFEKFSTKKQS